MGLAALIMREPWGYDAGIGLHGAQNPSRIPVPDSRHAVHSVEEYVTRLYEVLAPVRLASNLVRDRGGGLQRLAAEVQRSGF